MKDPFPSRTREKLEPPTLLVFEDDGNERTWLEEERLERPIGATHVAAIGGMCQPNIPPEPDRENRAGNL